MKGDLRARTAVSTVGKEYFIENASRTTFAKIYEKPRLCSRWRELDLALVSLHGGPGYPHNYLSNISSVHNIMPTVFYDQSPCGRSTGPDSGTSHTIVAHLDELSAVLKYFKINKTVLLGHSWGSILALEYYLRNPEQLSALILVSPCLSLPRWIEDSKHLRLGLNKSSQEILNTAEASFQFTGTAYQAAVQEYYEAYVYGADPQPEEIEYCSKNANSKVYQQMWGMNEFTVTGTLKKYDSSEMLKGVKIPVLYIAGTNDEVTPSTLDYYAQRTPDSSTHLVDGARHLPMFEQPKVFNQIIRDFLEGLEEPTIPRTK